MNFLEIDHLDNHYGKCTNWNCLFLANKLILKLRKKLQEKTRNEKVTSTGKKDHNHL